MPGSHQKTIDVEQMNVLSVLVGNGREIVLLLKFIIALQKTC